MPTSEGSFVAIGVDSTETGMPSQPISVPFVCYLAGVEPKDPKDYLWKNIANRAGLPAGKTQTVWRVIASDEVPKTNLQRIEKNGRTTTETLLGIAKAVNCEVWELLVPPDAQQAGATVATLPRKIGIEDAIGLMADALGKLGEDDRKHVLATLARYAADPERKPATLDYLRQELGGVRDEQARRSGTG